MKKHIKQLEYNAPEIEVVYLYSNTDLLEGSINDWVDDPNEID